MVVKCGIEQSVVAISVVTTHTDSCFEYVTLLRRSSRSDGLIEPLLWLAESCLGVNRRSCGLPSGHRSFAERDEDQDVNIGVTRQGLADGTALRLPTLANGNATLFVRRVPWCD